ncbi:ATP-grasp domain-containing protein [Roseiconus lacunae]|uniref:ATP-grasp domain-containing protein n=1 Tax=Roseiconus lacunae TaxID=2605694 RepID=UPI0013D9F3AA
MKLLPVATSFCVVGGFADGYDWLEPLEPQISSAYGSAALAEVFAASTDPILLSAIAAEAGVEFPNFRQQGRVPHRWLLKKRTSSGGLGVSVAADDGRIAEDSFAQQRVCGPVFGATLVTEGGRVSLLGVCRLLKKRLTGRPFVFAGAIGPLKIAKDVSDAVIRLADCWLRRFRMTGPLNIDFIIDPRTGRIWLLEINPRYSATMELIERAENDGDGPMLSLLGDPALVLGQQRSSERPVFVKRTLFARHDQSISAEQFEADVGSTKLKDFCWKDTPAQSAMIPAGAPIATMIYRFEADRWKRDHRVRTLP